MPILGERFYQMSNAIFYYDLKPIPLVIYSYLVCCAGQKDLCWPSIKTIALRCNSSENAARDAVKQLVDRGFIRKVKTSRCATKWVRWEEAEQRDKRVFTLWDGSERYGARDDEKQSAVDLSRGKNTVWSISKKGRGQPSPCSGRSKMIFSQVIRLNEFVYLPIFRCHQPLEDLKIDDLLSDRLYLAKK